MSDQITIENLIDGAIIEGFRRGTASFMESLEAELQLQAIVEEAGGDPAALLQEMIDATVSEKSSKQVNENIEDLGQKMNFLLS